MSNNVPDIGEMYDFWQLNEEIERALVAAYFMCKSHDQESKILPVLEKIKQIIKIESLGKKEGE